MSRRRGAVAGLAAASATLGAGELLSGFSGRVPSLVLGVADLLVAEAPGGIVRWSIDTFGTNQKTILVAGIVAASLLLGAALGVVARRRFVLGAAGFAGFGFLGGWAAAREALTAGAWGWLAAAVSSLVGVAAVRVLLRPGRLRHDSSRRRSVDDRTDRRGARSAPLPGGVECGGGARRDGWRSGAPAASGSRRRSRPEPGVSPSGRPAAASDRCRDPRRAGRGDLPDRHSERELLPHRHPNPRTPGRPRRLVAAHHRHGRPGGGAELRRAARHAPHRASTSPCHACPTRSAATWSATRCGPGVPLADLLDRAGPDPAATQVVGRVRGRLDRRLPHRSRHRRTAIHGRGGHER